ncbi:hypothetical protein ACFQDK_12830 [Sphingomonas yabuuchiae]
MADVFSSSADTVSSPATRAVAITPSDSTDLPDIPKGSMSARAAILR